MLTLHLGKAIKERPGSSWFPGLLFGLVACLWAPIGAPAAAQEPIAPENEAPENETSQNETSQNRPYGNRPIEESYERISRELYPDEVAPFYNLYAKFTLEERYALAWVIASLDEGEWGLFASLLMGTDEATAFAILQMFGSYDAAQMAIATNHLKSQSFDRWQAIPVLLQSERFEYARLAPLGSEAPNACREPLAQDAINPAINPASNTNAPAARICSEAELAFFDRFFRTVRRVTRGRLAKEGDAPWQAQLALHGASTRYFYSGDERRNQRTRFGRELKDWEINHSCGAVYLGGRFVLTAAHCIGDMDDALYFDRRRVHLGSVRIDGQRNLFKIRKVVTHANFNSSTLQNDIALIELAKVPTRLRYLRSARLPSAPAQPSGDVPLLLSGWGFSRPATRSSNIWTLSGQRQLPAQPNLLKGTVWVQPTDVCRNNRHFRARNIDIYPGQLCVGSPQGVDSCRGDSGGPLVDSNSEVLIGIVSGSAACGLVGTPSIFADVGYYRDWIDRAKAAAPRLAARRKHVLR